MINKSKNRKFRIFSILFSALLCACIINSSLPLTADAAMATGKAKFVGNIWYDGNVPSKFGDYWNQITPENASKWGSCESQQGVYNFSQAKAMYNYCKTNKIPFKFHTLIWGSQYPNWLGNLSGSARKTAIENWYKAAAQNFPDADYIDVVNEAMPGHAPFPYKNDIGGDNGLYGTGWDWIVWSFEMARKYFPNSKLLINDYNVLNEWSCLDQYIPVVKILKARNLIDGVGCQSHSLENTSAANLKSRLDKLAAAGVPIYISEFDLNIADDNTQKNKMQELFPVMYEHSAVKGITIWGYLQGHVWLSNSQLMRSDGSERPALTWLKQYMANVPGDNTPVEPRSAFTKLEAESYNDQSGIQNVTCDEGTDAVGYTENGDYTVYKSIDFGSGATSFQARVSSATSGGNIEIRLDSATGTLVGTCPVAATGDWQTFADAKCTVSGVTGKHDLYLKYTGGSGYLFNINWFMFGNTPVSTDKIGDLNSDGQIDALDFTVLKKCILGTGTIENTKLADLDASGTIDALDFVLMRQYLLGQITVFPANK